MTVKQGLHSIVSYYVWALFLIVLLYHSGPQDKNLRSTTEPENAKTKEAIIQSICFLISRYTKIWFLRAQDLKIKRSEIQFLKAHKSSATTMQPRTKFMYKFPSESI